MKELQKMETEKPPETFQDNTKNYKCLKLRNPVTAPESEALESIGTCFDSSFSSVPGSGVLLRSLSHEVFSLSPLQPLLIFLPALS